MDEDKRQLQSLFNYIGNSGNVDYVAENPQMRSLFDFAAALSTVGTAILLNGESGTGKEVLARHIHKNSSRKDRMFIPVNCAAIPENKMEFDFFGYEKGDFTGLFELADNGTLFFDEIGELPLQIQTTLLRVMETGEFKKLGSDTINKTDIRVIAATNRDLLAMTRNGTFREDLFYRLNVISLTIPPLRSRPEDVEPLIELYRKQFNKKHHTDTLFSEDMIHNLKAYQWPGNVRELRNIVEQLVITKAPVIPGSGIGAAPDTLSGNTLVAYKEYMEEIEKKYLCNALAICKGDIADMAKQMELHKSGIYRKLDKYDLNPAAYK
jgi:transcriptional regulator with PAS, ATPase and Fis domain